MSKKATLIGSQSGLPSGAIGIWYYDQYTASPRPLVANSATLTAVSGNIYGFSRRNFNNTALWTKQGETIVDSAAIAPDGSNDASTCVGTGNWFIGSADTTSLGAGTYTLAVNAKRNTGSDQSFCFTKDNTATRSSVKTATSAWQRFSYTFTIGATNLNTILLCSIDGSTAANLQICDLELYSGSSDLGPATPVGHLYLGLSALSQKPTAVTGALDFNGSNKFGGIQFPSSTSFTNITAVVAAKKVVTGAGSNYQSFLSDINGSYQQLTAFMEQNSSATTYFKGAVPQLLSLWEPFNQNWHMYSMSYDGVNLKMWLDDVLVINSLQSLSALAAFDFFVCAVNNLNLGANYQIAASALWTRALSKAEIARTLAVLKTRLALSSLTMADIRFIVAEGDSITEGVTHSTNAYPAVYNATPPNPLLMGFNNAVAGDGIAQLNARAAALDAKLPTTIGTRKFILTVLIGRNDLPAADPTTYAASLASYCDARRAAGWKVAICTILPSTALGFNTARNAVNTIIRGWTPGQHADALVDFGDTATTMGADAAAADTLLYQDGTHPTQLGQNDLAAEYAVIINAM